MNEQNLIPLNQRPERERKEIQRKGAEATNRKLRERKTLKEELLLLLSQGDTQQKVSLALIEKAMAGDTKAFETIRDTCGEKAPDKVEATLLGNIDIAIGFDEDEQQQD